MDTQRRYQVFVSSTFLDLREERSAIVQALLQLEAIPAGMELFPAADDDAWTLIQSVIDDCDYYLLVIGGKYGSVDPDTELSFTEKEFDYAVQQGKPVMAFVHSEPEELKLKDSEKNEEAREELDAFRERVKTTKHVKHWSQGPAELAGQVALSFGLFQRMYPAPGWIRGDTETAADALKEINDLRKQVASLEMELAAASRPQPKPKAELLEQGDASAEFEYPFRVEFLDDPDRSWSTTKYSGTIAADVTWDQLFSAIGAGMFDEASEPALRKTLGAWLTRQFRDEAVGRGQKAAARDKITIRGIRAAVVDMTSEDFGTLIVQLNAIGLIKKSDRNHGVKDKSTYWSLTPYGEEHLTGLRAIHREEPPEARPTDSGEGTAAAET